MTTTEGFVHPNFTVHNLDKFVGSGSLRINSQSFLKRPLESPRDMPRNRYLLNVLECLKREVVLWVRFCILGLPILISSPRQMQRENGSNLLAFITQHQGPMNLVTGGEEWVPKKVRNIDAANCFGFKIRCRRFRKNR